MFPGKTSHLLDCCSAHYISLVFLRKSRSIFTSACEYSKNICTTTKGFKVRGRATFFCGPCRQRLFLFYECFQSFSEYFSIFVFSILLIVIFYHHLLPHYHRSTVTSNNIASSEAQNLTTREPTGQLQSQGGERESKTYRSQKYGSTLEIERDNLREV